MIRLSVPCRTCLWSGTTTRVYGSPRRRIIWLPVWRRNTKPARSRAARTWRPDKPVEAWPRFPRQSLSRLHGFHLDELFAGLGRDRIACIAAVLDVELN